MKLSSPFFTSDLMLLGRIASEVQDEKSGQARMLGRTQKHGKRRCTVHLKWTGSTTDLGRDTKATASMFIIFSC